MGADAGDADGGQVDAALVDAAREPLPTTNAVDIVVIADDDSGGHFSNEEEALGGVLGDLVRAFQFIDRDHDGTADLPPASIHFASTSGDMGAPGVSDAGAGCADGSGDDGRFVGVGAMHPVPACNADPSGVLRFDGGDVEPFALNLDQCTNMLALGCSWPQMLEASLRALSPPASADGTSAVSWTADGYVPPVFLDGSYGRGGPDGTNGAFMRADSVLVVLFVGTPHDDCSTPDPSVFSLGDPRYTDIPFDQRCHIQPDRRYPVQRYVDGLIGLRRDPRRLVVGIVSGIPGDAMLLTPSEILASPDMQERPNPMMTDFLLPSCVGAYGADEPPRRYMEVADGLLARGASLVLASSCSLDHDTVALKNRLLDAIATSMSGG